MNLIKSLNLFLVLTISVSLVSCVTYYKGEYLTSEKTAAVVRASPVAQKKKVFVDYRYHWKPTPLKASVEDESSREQKAKYEDILRETGLFELVATESASDEIWKVENNFHNKSNAVWGVVSAVTLFLIPYWETDSFTELNLKVVKTNTRATSYEGTWTEHFVSVNQTLLVLAMPFNYSVPRRIQETSFRKSIDGYFGSLANQKAR